MLLGVILKNEFQSLITFMSRRELAGISCYLMFSYGEQQLLKKGIGAMTQNIQLWKANVFPENYIPPQPKTIYDLVVIGAGTAGLVTAAGAAGLGADVALIEAHAMGGDCLNVGCVPSKALIAAAKEFHRQSLSGMKGDGVDAFDKAMRRVREKRATISANDSVRRFSEMGIDVYLTRGRFSGEGVIEAGKFTLRYKKAVIAVGARASAPPVPGLAETPYLTNEDIFELRRRPDKLTIIGAGPIGVEMAQAFRRFGTDVQLVEVAPKILIREDPQAAKVIEKTLVDEGVKLYTGAKILHVTGDAQVQKIELKVAGKRLSLESDSLLVAAGRKPNTADLGLEAVGVELNERGGIVVDDRLRTTNRKIFSCGDVASPFQFTHAADFLARIVIQNSLFFGHKKASDLLIPWVTYSEPEIAHVGAYGHELEQSNTPFKRFALDFNEVDRAILEEKEGFCEILTDAKKGYILGATIVHDHAGDMISQITLAMQQKISLGKIASVIHPYPTQTEIIRKIGDQYNRSKLTPLVSRILKYIAKL